MTITRQDVEQIAALAKLRLAPKDIDTVRDSLNQVLSLVDRIQTADVAAIAPMRHPRDATQSLRADRVSESSRKADLMALAPAADGDYYLVPKVVDTE